jgi:hypothetical protein
VSIQIFDTDEQHLIKKGNVHRQTLRTQIDEALNNNQFKDNFIISSLPGLGKTHEMTEALKNVNDEVLVFTGDNGIFGYMIDLATAIYLNGGPQNRLTVVNDDCDVLFEDKNINTTKKMFDDTRMFKYGKNYKSIKPLCSDIQWEAILSFADETKAGLEIDVSNVTFITLTNMHLNTVDEVEAQEDGSAKYVRYNSRYAIRRRTQYKEIEMPVMELWGYVADVVLNEKICEKFMPNITDAHKVQLLQFLQTHWENGITERNLSIVEKMTKDFVRYPNNYKDIWKQEYVKSK